MLAIVEPEHLDEVLAICATLGGPRRGRRHGHRRRRRAAVLDGATARCSPTCPPRRCTRTRRCTTAPREPRRPAARVGRPPAPPAPATPAPTCWPAGRPDRGCGRQYDHQLFLNTVEGPGGDATRPAAEAPDHRRRHRPGPGAHHRRQPPLVRRRSRDGHGAARRRGGAEPGLRRRPAARRSSTASTSATRSTPR